MPVIVKTSLGRMCNAPSIRTALNIKYQDRYLLIEEHHIKLLFRDVLHSATRTATSSKKIKIGNLSEIYKLFILRTEN